MHGLFCANVGQHTVMCRKRQGQWSNTHVVNDEALKGVGVRASVVKDGLGITQAQVDAGQSVE